MLSFLKRNSKTKLEKAYKAKLEQAMLAQRNGDIRLYSELTAEAEAILKRIDNSTP